jgi:hypothetical protein
VTEQQPTLPTLEQPANLLSGPQTVESLRDAGYTDTERALAELIDNSFEADADNVVLVIVQQKGKHTLNQSRASWRVVEMYVVDDGSGMNAPVMNQALAFGAGTRRTRKGIGRFGMGLPQASVSQARRIDAWSWTDSYGQAQHTRVDLDGIAANADLTVPWPRPAVAPWTPAPPATEHSPPTDDPGSEIPPFLLESGVIDEVLHGDGAKHGTIIGWSKLDRTTWTTAAKVADHIAFFMGRTYRRFLSNETAEPLHDLSVGHAPEDLVNAIDTNETINVEEAAVLLTPIEGSDLRPRRLFVRVVTRTEDGASASHERITDFAAPGLDDQTGQVLPNDPNYLLSAKDTHLGSWPDVAGDTRTDPPFEMHKTPQVVFVGSRRNGDRTMYPVVITTTHSKKESRVPRTGDTYFGRHAKRNQGLSVLRAHRELLLLDALNDEAQRRFLGIQVDFPPQLDEVFGVTNNKQEATQLAVAIKVAKDNNDRPLTELIDHGILIEGSPAAAIYPVALAIRQRHSAAYRTVRAQQEGTLSKGPASPVNTSKEVEEASKTDQTAGPEELTAGETEAIKVSEAPDYQPAGVTEIEEDLTEAITGAAGADAVYQDEDIKVIAARLAAGSGYAFLIEFDSTNPSFFRVEERIGVPEARGRSKIIWLNLDHPLWSNYLDDLRADDEQLDQMAESELRELIRKARGVIVNMLISWSRIELGGTPSDRQSAVSTRERWGERAKRYIKPSEAPVLPNDLSLLDDDEMFGT